MAFWRQALLKLYYKVDELVEHTLGHNDLQQFFFFGMLWLLSRQTWVVAQLFLIK